MLIRSVILAATLTVGLAAGLAACSDDSDERPSDELTETVVECDEFEDTAKRITDAQADLYDGSGDDASAAIDTLTTELEALEEGAPAEVQDALNDLAEGFRDAEEALAEPTKERHAELAELADELAEDGRTVTTYIAEECR